MAALRVGGLWGFGGELAASARAAALPLTRLRACAASRTQDDTDSFMLHLRQLLGEQADAAAVAAAIATQQEQAAAAAAAALAADEVMAATAPDAAAVADQSLGTLGSGGDSGSKQRSGVAGRPPGNVSSPGRRQQQQQFSGSTASGLSGSRRRSLASR